MYITDEVVMTLYAEIKEIPIKYGIKAYNLLSQLILQESETRQKAKEEQKEDKENDTNVSEVCQ